MTTGSTFKVVPTIRARPNDWSYSIRVINAFILLIDTFKSMSLSSGIDVVIMGPFTVVQASLESHTSYFVVIFDSRIDCGGREIFD